MNTEERRGAEEVSRLLSCYFRAGEGGLKNDSVMLCEVVRDEIQSISLRVAAKGMARTDEAS